MQGEISGCLYHETVCIEVKVGTPFQIGNICSRVASGSLCMTWTGQHSTKGAGGILVWIGTGWSEFTTMQVDHCPFIHFESI